MRNDFNYMLINDGTRVIVFNGTAVTREFSKMPARFIEIIANKLELYLHVDTSMYSGKHIYKVSKVCNIQGGVINLFATTSRAKFNRFVTQYVNIK